MKSLFHSFAVVVLGLALAAPAAAQCCKGKANAEQTVAQGAEKSCSGAKTVSDEGAKKCDGKAMAGCGMPCMKYRVGDRTVCCPKEAQELAGENGKITYILADKEYADQAEAMKAYETVLDQHLAKLTSVQYAVGDKTVTCGESAARLAADNGSKVQYRVASYSFAEQTGAQKAAEAARTAANNVKMFCVVDGKTIECNPAECAKAGCDKMASKDGAAKVASNTETGGKSCHGEAKATAEGKTCDKSGATAQVASGKTCDKSGATAQVAAGKTCHKGGEALASNCQYKVGDVVTPCQVAAKVELAKARIQAAYEALAQAAGQNQGQEVAAGNTPAGA